MAISRARKEELVAQYVDLLEKSNGFIVVAYSGLTVPQTQDLRKKILDAEGQYAVTKNTLFTKALQQLDWPVPDELLAGPTAVAFGLENMPGVAKAILDFTKEVANPDRLQVTGGVMTGSMLDAKQIEDVSKLPTLDELRAQLAGLVISPAQGLVTVLNAANSQIVNVIQAYLDDRGESNEDEAA